MTATRPATRFARAEADYALDLAAHPEVEEQAMSEAWDKVGGAAICCDIPGTKEWPYRNCTVVLTPDCPWAAEAKVYGVRGERTTEKRYLVERDGVLILITPVGDPDHNYYVVSPDGGCSCKWARTHSRCCDLHKGIRDVFIELVRQAGRGGS